MSLNVIRPFLRTLSGFSSSAQRYLILNSKRKNNYARAVSLINIDKNLNCRCFCSNSLETNSKLDTDEKNTADSKEPETDSNERIQLIFKNIKGEIFEVSGKIGQSVLEAAKDGGIDMPGACVGQLTCTTCHVYVDETCDFLLDNISIQEDDMLDKAPFLKENSRLSCQIPVTKELHGKTFILPKATRNFAVDGSDSSTKD